MRVYTRVLALLEISALCVCLSFALPRPDMDNGRPVVGVLMQEKNSAPPYTAYIMSDYASYLQQSGAQVVPIFTNETVGYYKALMLKINGVLYPGGGSDLISSPYAKAGKIIFDLAKEMNDRGDYFPVWGTCLGFELMHDIFFSPPKSVLGKCDGTSGGVYLNINFTNDARRSRLFSEMPRDLVEAMANEPLTGNYHHQCMPMASYDTHTDLLRFYRILSTNVDVNGVEFSSTMEAVHYPFYATQWHPEKNNYWWYPVNSDISHSFNAVRVSQYLSNFFVNECRRSSHRFGSLEDIGNAVIQNYARVYRPGHSDDYYFK